VFLLRITYLYPGVLIWLLVIIGLASVLSSPVFAADISGWSDKTVCRLAATSPDNPDYAAEVQRRKMDCSSGLRSSGKSSSDRNQPTQALLAKNQGVVFYPLLLDPKVKQQLLANPINKMEFDFSPYTLATLDQPITCQFNLIRVSYEDYVEGRLENWNMARGSMLLTANGVKIDGFWRMGGLSKDSSYLKHEVNLKLTNTGHLVGKMAYFHLSVNPGEALKKPLYVELKPHKRSIPLDVNNLKEGELWIDVEDWAGGVLYLKQCKKISLSS